jgi:hypothetical protein
VSGLALIEILFYFYYIGPMESNIFKNTLKNDLFLNDYTNNLNYNISEIIININNNIGNYEEIINEKDKDRMKSNNDLFNKTMIYWSFMLLVSCMVFIVYKIIKRRRMNNESSSLIEINSNMSIEMIENVSSRNIILNDDTSSNNSEFVNELQTKNLYKKMILYKIIYYLLNCGLILGFEFWFFNNVVLKYKVISTEEMEYLFLQNIKKSLTS